MKTTGITRRIDELGRIVIPKEIRKNLHIKSGELLEIYLSDSDTISLKKHSILNNDQEFIKYYIKALSKKTNSDIFVTSLDKIVFSTIPDFVDKYISSQFEEQIKNGSIFKNVSKLVLFKDFEIDDNFMIFPISPNGDIVGVMIYAFKKKNDENYDELIKFSTYFLESYLESY